MEIQQQTPTPQQPPQLRTLDCKFSEIPEGHGVFAVMDKTGDTKYLWDKNNPAEVEVARSTFNSFIAKKYLAFKVTDKEGTKGEQAKEFDPNAERYIFSPPMQGG